MASSATPFFVERQVEFAIAARWNQKMRPHMVAKANALSHNDLVKSAFNTYPRAVFIKLLQDKFDSNYDTAAVVHAVLSEMARAKV